MTLPRKATTMMTSKDRERLDRARQVLREPPKARTPAQRMAAAAGAHLHGQNMRLTEAARRRIHAHRGQH